MPLRWISSAAATVRRSNAVRSPRIVLAALIGSDMPDCEKVDTDRYKRTIARCTVGGRDLGSLMVQSGWAVDFTRYSRGHYATEETAAKDDERGLWGGAFVMPWEWRRGR